MWKLMVALVVGMAVTGGSVASAEDPGNALTVTLHVTNYADISPKELAVAEAYATAIYRDADIQTVWTSAPWASGETRLPHLRVVLLSPRMTAKKCKEARIGETFMGIAADGATDGSGRIAYIFPDRIRQAAFQHLYVAKFDRGLGHVMAHEVGHLLLGGHSHAPAGLMTVNWNPLEMRLQTLTPQQAQIIRVRATVPTEDMSRHSALARSDAVGAGLP